MAWFDFCLAYFFGFISIFLPGFLAFSLIGLNKIKSFCIAPVFSIAMYAILGIAFSKINVFSSWYTIVLIPTFILLIILLFRYLFFFDKKGAFNTAQCFPKVDSKALILYLIVGFLFVVFLFVGNLDGPNSFQPDNDNAWHLGLIRVFAESGNYSCLSTSIYAISDVAPNLSHAFYPAAMHEVAASLVSLLSVSPQLAENAVAAVTISCVYPAGIVFFLSTIANKRNEKIIIYIGAISCFLVTAFPWRFITWGPLFPNLLSLSIVAIVLASLIVFVRMKNNLRYKVFWAIVSVVGLFSIAITHPNGVFTLGIFFVFYIVQAIWKNEIYDFIAINKSRSIVLCLKLLVCFIWLLFVVAVWVLAFKAPFLQGVVNFTWDPYQSVSDSVWSIATLSFTRGFCNPAVAVLLVLGIVAIVVKFKDFFWLIVAFIFTSFQFCICSSTEGILDQLLCGFWYTDPNRIAANVALSAVPIVAVGFAYLILLTRRVFEKTKISNRWLKVTEFLPIAIIMLICFVPSINSFGLPLTAFFDSNNLMQDKYGVYSVKGYTEEEKEFVDEAKRLLPEDEIILNIPNDGSCFAFSLQDVNVFYKDVSISGGKAGSETEDSFLLRTKLNEISTNNEVKSVISDLGIEYVLQLDQENFDPNSLYMLPQYIPEAWMGISRITDQTPGFEVVLAKDDMRLYRITI